MIVALFGITCVGKTTIGKIISDELHYEFYDLDAELKLYFKDTITNIQNSCFNQHEYDGKKIEVLKSILTRCGNNSIIAVSPIYYTATYKKPFRTHNVFPIELRDLPENIALRMIETDDEDNLIENYVGNYKLDLRDTKYFISRYKNAFSWIETKYEINGKSALDAATDLCILVSEAAQKRLQG